LEKGVRKLERGREGVHEIEMKSPRNLSSFTHISQRPFVPVILGVAPRDSSLNLNVR
jgi:hypothetical protein